MATNAELAMKIRLLEDAMAEMQDGFDSYEETRGEPADDSYDPIFEEFDRMINELRAVIREMRDPYLCPECKGLMKFKPMARNFYCFKCNIEKPLYPGMGLNARKKGGK